MVGTIKTWPDGDGVGRVIKWLEENDPDGSWEEVWVEAIAVYLGVSKKVVEGQLAVRRRKAG